MGKETYYFSHDANARNDEKILMLRAEHGWIGYGIYWALLEMMFESADTKLFHNKVKGIAVSYNIDITLLNDVINTAITENLFFSDGDKFWSESLMRRKNKFHEAKHKKSEAGKKGMAKRWANKGIDNTVITDDNDVNNGVITKNNKEKESKVKESKLNKKTTTHKFEICDMESAKLLFDLMLENNPSIKKPNLEKWADDVRKMRELDKRKTEHINYMIRWAQENEFWKTNILSPSKLREKYDQLVVKAKQEHERKSNVHRMDKPKAFASLEQWAMEGETET